MPRHLLLAISPLPPYWTLVPHDPVTLSFLPLLAPIKLIPSLSPLCPTSKLCVSPFTDCSYTDLSMVTCAHPSGLSLSVTSSESPFKHFPVTLSHHHDLFFFLSWHLPLLDVFLAYHLFFWARTESPHEQELISLLTISPASNTISGT